MKQAEGGAGQLEHSLVKKSIKEEQRQSGGKNCFSLQLFFLANECKGLFTGNACFPEGKEV